MQEKKSISLAYILQFLYLCGLNTQIGNTRMVSNQLSDVFRNEHIKIGFDPSRHIVIN